MFTLARNSLAHAPRGLTLAEVLIVIALTAIMAGMAVIQFAPSVTNELDGAAQTVASDCDYARNLAVANNSKYTITFDVPSNSYYLTHSGTNTALNVLPKSSFSQPTDPNNRITTSFAKLPGLTDVTLVNAYTIVSNVASTVTSVEFDTLGNTVRTTDTIVWLRAGTGNSRRFIPVTIYAPTGLVDLGDPVTAMPY